jgi:hypothetical protein
VPPQALDVDAAASARSQRPRARRRYILAMITQGFGPRTLNVESASLARAEPEDCPHRGFSFGNSVIRMLVHP